MPAKCIMIQGTMSNSGKTFVTAGLCRVFAQDGYKVAPFKSQNMALNSYITEEGLEIGRAQAMQAEAAGIKPTVFMNPILLKPTTAMGSQVIVNGEVYGNLSAQDYFKMKAKLVPDIMKAYRTLEEEYDIIVIEGAGSPAEINLKSEDIVNMGLAKMVNAPVLLVADIDRGGVFASLYGTIELLEEEEKERIKGMIINKFRGDKKILESGLTMIEDLTKKPVVGVIPMEEIVLDDEDSLSSQLYRKQQLEGKDVAIIRFPHISNFTDFLALDFYDGISVRYVERKEELKNPDYILLPGTKNTMADLKWLKETGLEGAILRKKGKAHIFGICGGFQMLGKRLDDKNHVEYGGTMKGMELLDFETIFLEGKTRTQIKGKLACGAVLFQEERKEEQEQELHGYEIHMGKTNYEDGAKPFSILEDDRMDGCISEDGMVAGTYLHGIFDNEMFAKAYFQLEEKEEEQSFEQFKNSQYDKLADLIRSSIDMEEVYRILEI
ncbi:MAG: cobyric acid synthase [Clostridiales bacterium]|nr:cobyric acid synthase [Clostridiales bacterium]